MKEKYKSILDKSALLVFALLMLVGFLAGRCSVPEVYNPPVIAITVDSIPSFFGQTPNEGLYDAMDYYGIRHPEIVYKQALLETGNFTSKACLEQNNLFGLYNSKTGKYYSFIHWSQSVVAYKDFIQYKYKGGDYYKFLQSIGYAEDPLYIDKLKNIK